MAHVRVADLTHPITSNGDVEVLVEWLISGESKAKFVHPFSDEEVSPDPPVTIYFSLRNVAERLKSFQLTNVESAIAKIVKQHHLALFGNIAEDDLVVDVSPRVSLQVEEAILKAA